jgi:hypothetical protein
VPPSHFRLGRDGGEGATKPPRPISAGRQRPLARIDNRGNATPVPVVATSSDPSGLLLVTAALVTPLPHDRLTGATPTPRPPARSASATPKPRAVAMPELAVDRSYLSELAADSRLFTNDRNMNNTPYDAVTMNNHNHPANAYIRPLKSQAKPAVDPSAEQAHRAISAAADWTEAELHALMTGGGAAGVAGARSRKHARHERGKKPSRRGEPVPLPPELPKRMIARVVSGGQATGRTLDDFRKEAERDRKVSATAVVKVSYTQNAKMQALVREALDYLTVRDEFWKHTDIATHLPFSSEVAAATVAAARDADLVRRAASSAGGGDEASPSRSSRRSSRAVSGPDLERLARPTTSSAHRAEIILDQLHERQRESDVANGNPEFASPRGPSRLAARSISAMQPMAIDNAGDLLDIVRAVTSFNPYHPAAQVRPVSAMQSAQPRAPSSADAVLNHRASPQRPTLSRRKLLERQMSNRFTNSAAERRSLAAAATTATAFSDNDLDTSMDLDKNAHQTPQDAKVAIAWNLAQGGRGEISLSWGRAGPVGMDGNGDDTTSTVGSDNDGDDDISQLRAAGYPGARRPQRMQPHQPTAREKASMLAVVKSRLTDAELPYEAALRRETAEVHEINSGAAFATHSRAVGSSRAAVEDKMHAAEAARNRRPWLQGSVREPADMKKHRLRAQSRALSADPLLFEDSLLLSNADVDAAPSGGMGRLHELLDDESAASATSSTMTARGTGQTRNIETVRAHERGIKAEMIHITTLVERGNYPDAIIAIRALLRNVSSVSQISVDDPKAQLTVQAKLLLLLGTLYVHLGDDGSACRELSAAAIMARRAKEPTLYASAIKALATRYSDGSVAVLAPVGVGTDHKDSTLQDGTPEHHVLMGEGRSHLRTEGERNTPVDAERDDGGSGRSSRNSSKLADMQEVHTESDSDDASP